MGSRTFALGVDSSGYDFRNVSSITRLLGKEFCSKVGKE